MPTSTRWAARCGRPASGATWAWSARSWACWRWAACSATSARRACRRACWPSRRRCRPTRWRWCASTCATGWRSSRTRRESRWPPSRSWPPTTSASTAAAIPMGSRGARSRSSGGWWASWTARHAELAVQQVFRHLEVPFRGPQGRQSFGILSRIRDLGVKVSIDDFGTGYSCLAYFKDIPADELKIDRSFVQGMVSDTASADIATLIIDLAHRFGLSVVAEGVEDIETFKLLRQRDCDVVQGHFFARAMRTDAFATWLQARSAVRA